MKTKLLDLLTMLVFGVLLGWLAVEFLTGFDPFYN